MKFVKGALIGLGAAFALFCGLVIYCAFNPDASEKIAQALYSGRGTPVEEETSETSETAETAEASLEEDGSEVNTQDGDTASPYYQDSSEDADTARVTIDWDSLYRDRAADLAEEEEEEETGDAYVAPTTATTVPEEVKDRAGYVEIEDAGESIGDTEAAELATGTGPIGSELEFDPLYYPYFAMLSAQEKDVYRQIYANADALNTAFKPVEEVNVSQMRNIFAAVCHDHPELFWLETAYGSKYNQSGVCVEVELKYNDTVKDLGTAMDKFDTRASEIIYAASGLESDFEKEQYVHERLMEQVSYNESSAMNQSAYSAIVNGQSVCAGYSRAFQYIMQKLGIPTYYCAGSVGESHAWNIVKLDDGYYNVDVTWDDASSDPYSYFNKTDADYASTHIRMELSVNLPPCNGKTYRVETDEEGETKLDMYLRTLTEAGYGTGDVFTDIWDYYEDCQWRIEQGGTGYYIFDSVLSGAGLFEEWQSNYENNLHWPNYLNEALKDMEASYCHITVEVERLQDGYYLITHKVSVG